MNLKANVLIALFTIVGTYSFGQGQLGIRFFTGIQNQSTATEYLLKNARNLHYKIDLESISNSQSVGLFSQFNFG